MTSSEKFDGPTRHLLSSAAAGDEVSVFLRGDHPFTDEDVRRLEHAGARVRTVAGDVCTATVAVGALEAVADQQFVTAVQASGPLYYEDGGSTVPLSDVE